MHTYFALGFDKVWCLQKTRRVVMESSFVIRQSIAFLQKWFAMETETALTEKTKQPKLAKVRLRFGTRG